MTSIPSASEPDPFPQYAELRSRQPVSCVATGSHGNQVWFVTGYDEARALLADPRLSKDTRRAAHIFARRGPRRNLSEAVSATMLATDPPDHTRLRRLVSAAFTPGAVRRLRPDIEATCGELLDAIVPRGSADLIEEFAMPLPATVICALLGVPGGDRDRLRGLSDALFVAGRPDIIDDASHQIANYMADLVTGKRSRPGPDLLSDLVAVRDSGDQLDDAELVSLATLLLVAGHETTTNLIGNGTLALLSNPDRLAALRADRGVLPAAVEEVLRYDPPAATATFRWTTEPVRIGDVVIPADQVVMISLAGANRDPAAFPDPDVFDLDRDTGGHLAFGHGIHYCLGAPLARLEARIAFDQLLTRLPDLRLACDPETLRWRHTRLMRGLEHLPVAFTAASAGH